MKKTLYLILAASIICLASCTKKYPQTDFYMGQVFFPSDVPAFFYDYTTGASYGIKPGEQFDSIVRIYEAGERTDSIIFVKLRGAIDTTTTPAELIITSVSTFVPEYYTREISFLVQEYSADSHAMLMQLRPDYSYRVMDENSGAIVEEGTWGRASENLLIMHDKINNKKSSYTIMFQGLFGLVSNEKKSFIYFPYDDYKEE